MEILNKNGMILMDYRREFKRHYADSVDEALKDAILTLYKEGQIPEKLFRIILDDNIDDSVVYTYLLSRREFTKSSMELNSEFNEVRERVNDYLIKINFVKNVCTKNSVNTNRIYVIKQYDIPKELLLSYFGLTHSEIIPLMKRKGFMDKFCVLRLSQAFKEIYSELRVPEHIDHGYSLIYYNKLIQGFSIDYKYMVNVNYINDEERLADLMDKIKKLDEVVERKFESKMSYSYFQQLDKKMSATELAAEIDKIVIPVRSGKRAQDIRKPELIVEEAENEIQKQEEKPVDKPVVAPVKNAEVKSENKPQSTSPILVVDEDDDIIVTKDKKSEVTSDKKDKPVEKPQGDRKQEVDKTQKPQQKPESPKPEQPKQEQPKAEQPKKEPQPNGQKQNNGNQGNQQKNNGGNKQNGKPNPNQQNGQKQPQQQQQQPKHVEQKPQDKPKADVKPEPVERREEKKEPEKKEPVKNIPPVQNQPKPVEQKPDVVKPKNDFDDDDDDDLGEVIVAPKKETPKPKTPANGGKPTLIIDDSDTDLI